MMMLVAVEDGYIKSLDHLIGDYITDWQDTSEVPPDSRFLYANTNSKLLCLVLEAASVKLNAAYLTARLWQRLKVMHEAKRFYNDEKTSPGLVAKEPFAIDDMVYFDGSGCQRVYVSRKQDLVIVRIGDMNLNWDDSLHPNLVVRTLDNRKQSLLSNMRHYDEFAR